LHVEELPDSLVGIIDEFGSRESDFELIKYNITTKLTITERGEIIKTVDNNK
jgi:hypothetical protein